ncbi:MAG: PIN domain-containing protein [Granulosicoccus sp.]
MSDRFFIDTNILIYTFDRSSPSKRKTAISLVETALASGLGCISFQVVQECLNVLTRKFRVPLDAEQARNYLQTTLMPVCRVHSSIPLYERAIDLHERWQFSLYDTLILASALEANCSILFSEDMQHKQKIESLVVINPFTDTQQVNDVTDKYQVDSPEHP